MEIFSQKVISFSRRDCVFDDANLLVESLIQTIQNETKHSEEWDVDKKCT